jgi:hypothetical protein
MKFNRVFGNTLLIYNLAQESVISFSIKILFKIIVLNRHKRVLPGISIKIEKITDLKLLLMIRKYDMRTEASRRKYVNYKINGKISRKARQINANLTNIEFARIINIRYLQYNIYLCRKGKYWERYYNSRKVF